ncbi:hypothetical protein [Sporomusa acidovorans]|uniref:Glycosyltransferase 2-like domain-containing protein n=1 Tax=Sporomusa acidovorans (strain ATCC 49682 / DSM 3132 / Mol) TaxID=1123286 RepID=A0ABZ3J7S4_SPOA4|nr:hypothetical protein [Sporomusa acidovorans]OZC19396.1 N-glycosyltransferase [Sporomusa acidovorans DSM 3132]SDD78122.1 hypothetical protein SAMN04488499_100430 [Sporomusa acidovorans]
MFLSYSATVILLSLALYGLWYILKDAWGWFTTLEFVRLPTASFVILVHNMEYEVEDLMRFLIKEMAEGGHEIDVVVVDCGSDDLTPTILRRLAGEMPALTVVNSVSMARPVAEALPLCRGAVVHVLDLTSRLKSKQFMAVVSSLLRKNQREVAVKGGADG